MTAKKKKRTLSQVIAELERMVESRVVALDYRSQGLMLLEDYRSLIYGEARSFWRGSKELTCAFCHERFEVEDQEYYDDGVMIKTGRRYRPEFTAHANNQGRYGRHLGFESTIFFACSQACQDYLYRRAARITEQLEKEWKAINQARSLLKRAKQMVKEKLNPNPSPSQNVESEPPMTLHI